MASEPTDLRVRISLPEPKDAPPPEAANFFHFSFAGPEVQLMVGYVDLRSIHDARENPIKGRGLLPHISHRFSVGPVGFAILRQQIEDIAKKYDAAQADARDRVGDGKV